MVRSTRLRLVEHEHLVVVHAENLPGNSLGTVGGQINGERCDLFRRYLLHARDPRRSSVFSAGIELMILVHAKGAMQFERTLKRCLHVERDAA